MLISFVWNLNIEIWNLFKIWNLRFGIFVISLCVPFFRVYLLGMTVLWCHPERSRRVQQLINSNPEYSELYFVTFFENNIDTLFLKPQIYPCQKINACLWEITVHHIFFVFVIITIYPCIGFVFFVKNIINH